MPGHMEYNRLKYQEIIKKKPDSLGKGGKICPEEGSKPGKLRQ